MADRPISDLAGITPADNDKIYVSQTTGGPLDKSTTLGELKAYVGGSSSQTNWYEARGVLNGGGDYIDLDWRHGFPLRETDTFTATVAGSTFGLEVPQEGLYHLTAQVLWEHINGSGTYPEYIDLFVAGRTANYYGTTKRLYSHTVDVSAADESYGTLDVIVYVPAGEDIYIEVGGGGSDGNYVGIVHVYSVGITRLGTLPAVPPPPPASMVQAVSAGTWPTDTSMRFSWTMGLGMAAASADTNVRLDGTTEIAVTAGATTGDATGLTANTEYLLEAQHVDASVESVWKLYSTGIAASTRWTRPVAPSGITLTPDIAQVTVDWTNTHSGISVRVYRDAALVHTSAIDATQWIDTGRTPSTLYDYKIYHYNGTSTFESIAFDQDSTTTLGITTSTTTTSSTTTSSTTTTTTL